MRASAARHADGGIDTAIPFGPRRRVRLETALTFVGAADEVRLDLSERDVVWLVAFVPAFDGGHAAWRFDVTDAWRPARFLAAVWRFADRLQRWARDG